MRKISEGGQAKIFLAWLKHNSVVVKRYKDPNVSVADLQRQMEMVMKACEGRSESGLCKVNGVSRDKKGKALLVMQPMEGDLRNLIDSKNGFHFSSKRDILWGIARGLKNLHACGRIHKDVKASNILVKTRESEPIPIPRVEMRDTVRICSLVILVFIVTVALLVVVGSTFPAFRCLTISVGKFYIIQILLSTLTSGTTRVWMVFSAQAFGGHPKC